MYLDLLFYVFLCLLTVMNKTEGDVVSDSFYVVRLLTLQKFTFYHFLFLDNPLWKTDHVKVYVI